MVTTLSKPSLFPHEINVQQTGHLSLFKFSDRLQDRMEQLLDKKKAEALHKHYKSLKKYRQDHIDSIKPITILIVILIMACLIYILINLDNYPVIFLTIKISTIITTIYTIYETIDAMLYLFINPFTNNK
jgi:hypothetical protein